MPTATTATMTRNMASGQVSDSVRYGTITPGLSMAWTTPCLMVAKRISPNTAPTT